MPCERERAAPQARKFAAAKRQRIAQCEFTSSEHVKARDPAKACFCGNKRNKNAEISKRALEKLGKLDLS